MDKTVNCPTAAFGQRMTSDAFTLVFAETLRAPVPVPAPDAPGISIWRDADERLVAWGRGEHDEHWMHWPGLASFHFTAAGTAITAFPAPGTRPDIIRDTWLRSVVPMALQALGREALHASAVLGARGVVAFCAQSQTGKSTLAYGLARRGFAQWADDAVVVEMESGIPTALALPFHVRLRPASATFYGHPAQTTPGLISSGTTPELKTTPGVISESSPGVISRPPRGSAPIAAACVLERQPADNASGQVTVERLESSRAFVALLTHAYCFNPADASRRAAMLQHYLDMAATVPVFRLAFPADLARMRELLDAAETLLDHAHDDGSGPCAR